MKFDLELLKELGRSIEKHNLTEIEVEIEGKKITMKKEEIVQAVAETRVVAQAPQQVVAQPQSIVAEEAAVVSLEDLNDVTSPMVGTYYSAPSPDSPEFAKVGDVVQVGDTLCIVEAMKMMNEVKSTVAGEIVEIKEKNGNIVKKGQVLFVIK